jgi:hypothetical protein
VRLGAKAPHGRLVPRASDECSQIHVGTPHGCRTVIRPSTRRNGRNLQVRASVADALEIVGLPTSAIRTRLGRFTRQTRV